MVDEWQMSQSVEHQLYGPMKVIGKATQQGIIQAETIFPCVPSDKVTCQTLLAMQK